MQLKNSVHTIASGVLNNMFFTDCSNWYAVETTIGYEKKLISTIGILCGGRIKLFLPTREVFHTLKGVRYKKGLPLFPGYVFVYNDIRQLLHLLHKSNTRIPAKPVTADGKCLEVHRDEMKFLFDITGQDGIIKISTGVITKNEEIRIVDGPLKDLTGQILYIDKRKNKAKARIEMMNRLIDVSLGLEIIAGSAPAHIP